MTFEDFIMEARRLGASDIHLTVGAPTVVRINGELRKFAELSDAVVNRTILSILTASQEKQLTEGADINLSFELGNGMRQRVNVFRHSGRLACSIRLLRESIPTLTELKLPPVIAEMVQKRRGLILVTGPAGSGKSTTLAAMINYINSTRACHIITVEDPVEYRYIPDKATIHQREIGRDVPDFNYAMQSALREDPDVIFIGELRDYETVSLAMTAAETGRLVFAAMNTSGAAQTIERLIDVCPEHAKERIRAQLADMIQGIVSQTLVPIADGRGRIAAAGIMTGGDIIRDLIRTNKISQIESTIRSCDRLGMCLLDDILVKYYENGIILYETAVDYSADSDEMAKFLGQE